MPDHADAAVAFLAAGHRAGVIMSAFLREPLSLMPTLRRDRSAQGLFQCNVDRMELVIARDLFGQFAVAFVLEHDEMPDEIEKAPLLEDALQHHLKLSKAVTSSRPVIVRQGLNHSLPAPSEPIRA